MLNLLKIDFLIDFNYPVVIQNDRTMAWIERARIEEKERESENVPNKKLLLGSRDLDQLEFIHGQHEHHCKIYQQVNKRMQ